MATFNDDTQALIDRYLNDELKGDEKQNFVQTLEVDAVLNEEVQLLQKIATGVRANAALKERLKKIDKETSQADNVVPMKKRRFMYQIAAAACILLVGIVAFLNWPTSMSTNELYAANFEILDSEQARGATKGPDGQATESPSLKAAWAAYDTKDYNKALPLFQENETPKLLHYIANSHMALGQFAQAIPILDRSLTFKENAEYHDEALWYKALCQVKLGQVEAAKATLLQLQSESDASGNLIKMAKKLEKAL